MHTWTWEWLLVALLATSAVARPQFQSQPSPRYGSGDPNFIGGTPDFNGGYPGNSGGYPGNTGGYPGNSGG